jgi:predicted dehydrogenase
MRKIRWGILSTAKIATEKVIPGMHRSTHCAVTAIASRVIDRARLAANRWGIPKVYGDYQELLADPEIDAVYIPLPNHLHVPWSVKALEAGKHVLCEKPIGLSVADAQALLKAARRRPDLRVMEAFMYRHHPQWRRARELVDAGGIGQLRTIQSFFSYYNADPANIRNKSDIGGGALMDIGCYSISLSRFIFDAEPERVLGIIERDPTFGTDRIVSGIMDFGRGTSTFTCSTQLTPYQRVNIFGDDGRIEIEIPFNAPPDRPCRMWYQRNGRIEEVVLEVCDQYALQGDVFSRSVLDDTPVPVPLEDAVTNMGVIEALFHSAEHHVWVKPDRQA